MRHNVRVTDAAIAAGVHLVDLGSYYPETLSNSSGTTPRRRPDAGSSPAAAWRPV